MCNLVKQWVSDVICRGKDCSTAIQFQNMSLNVFHFTFGPNFMSLLKSACEQFAALLSSSDHDCHVTVWPQARETEPPFMSSLTGKEMHLFLHGFLPLLISLIACKWSHLLWHSSCQCGHRNQSVLRWPHSPPRWRHDLRCAAGRRPPWMERCRVGGEKYEVQVFVVE